MQTTEKRATFILYFKSRLVDKNGKIANSCNIDLFQNQQMQKIRVDNSFKFVDLFVNIECNYLYFLNEITFEILDKYVTDNVLYIVASERKGNHKTDN